MKRKSTVLSQQYAAALGKYLTRGPRGSLLPARGLGRRAVSLGLETLDVVRIHEGALASLRAVNGPNEVLQRAETFFTEVITPIEKTHSAALKASAHLNQVNRTLDRRTSDLAASHLSLKQTIVRRKALEQALRRSGAESQKLLEESRRLHQHLKHLTHRLLSAQEAKRKKMSCDLQDDIIQTLLGINVRLLTVKKAANLGDAALQKEIANTQRLVDISVKGIERFAGEHGKKP
jgi:signal transduction histidine kinase